MAKLVITGAGANYRDPDGNLCTVSRGDQVDLPDAEAKRLVELGVAAKPGSDDAKRAERRSRVTPPPEQKGAPGHPAEAVASAGERTPGSRDK